VTPSPKKIKKEERNEKSPEPGRDSSDGGDRAGCRIAMFLIATYEGE
jgi:hypothetical protein